MNNELIDFDSRFADFMSGWIKDHRSEYNNFDDMEADMPRIYTRFLNTPAGWLGEITPGAYFTQFEDAKDLVDWMSAYCESEIPVPDLLLEQIVNVGRPCEKRLFELINDDHACEEAKMTAIGLLRDMESELPKILYINMQLDRKQDDDLADSAIESLNAMGNTVVQPILQVIKKANIYGQEALLDVLTNYPGNEQTFSLAIKLFREQPEKRALFAGYLAKLGDLRALDVLIEAASEPDCRYLTFIEIRNAIEELGGDCPERAFDDDPEYDALSKLDDLT